MNDYESRIMWRIHSTEQRIFMNCKSRITNHEYAHSLAPA